MTVAIVSTVTIYHLINRNSNIAFWQKKEEQHETSKESTIFLIAILFGLSCLQFNCGTDNRGKTEITDTTDPTNPNNTTNPSNSSDKDLIRSTKQRITNPSVPVSDSTQLAADNSNFAFDLYRQVTGAEEKSGSKNSNLFYSPYSISEALAMAFAGAQNNTAKEMAQTLHYNLPQEGKKL